jgi:hypothetical protein
MRYRNLDDYMHPGGFDFCLSENHSLKTQAYRLKKEKTGPLAFKYVADVLLK